MSYKLFISWLIVLPVFAALAGGCSETPELPGGTRGIILVQRMPMADIQVNIYQDGTEGPIAFGISECDGHFELRLPRTLEAVWLQPGHYRMTVESVGEHFIRWAPHFSDPANTPLQQHWSGDADEFLVEIPNAPKYEN
ncbi:MAG: hypothetical protein KDA90_19885 [Planctomycetaceae bacterium]|nr:hypothetical protein [Planctomycetaceae bacterium]